MMRVRHYPSRGSGFLPILALASFVLTSRDRLLNTVAGMLKFQD